MLRVATVARPARVPVRVTPTVGVVATPVAALLVEVVSPVEVGVIAAAEAVLAAAPAAAEAVTTKRGLPLDVAAHLHLGDAMVGVDQD
jgi:hypothetical protein